VKGTPGWPIPGLRAAAGVALKLKPRFQHAKTNQQMM
jgi:hypothetical protein